MLVDQDPVKLFGCRRIEGLFPLELLVSFFENLFEKFMSQVLGRVSRSLSPQNFCPQGIVDVREFGKSFPIFFIMLVPCIFFFLVAVVYSM